MRRTEKHLKKKNVQIRLTVDQEQEARELAELAYMPLASWLRRAVLITISTEKQSKSFHSAEKKA